MEENSIVGEPATNLDSPPVELLPAPVSDEIIERLAERLRDLARTATLELTLRIGEMIVRELYQGDLALWRSHGPKEASFRRLAEFTEPSLSHSSLQRSVALYELHQRLGCPEWARLGVSHLRAVLGLPEAEQARLLTEANAQGWTASRLLEEVKGVRQLTASESHAGRPPLPRFVKTVHQFARVLQDADASFGDIEAIEDMDLEQARGLRDTVCDLRARCDSLESRLLERIGRDDS
jgi:hypothetical protein